MLFYISKNYVNLVIVYAGYNQSESMRHIEVRLFQGTEQLLCDELALECDEEHNNSKLVVKNSIFHHRWFKRQFNSIKTDNDNQLSLARQSAISERIIQLEQQMINQIRLIELLEKRTSCFHYSLGEIQKFIFNDPNDKTYQVRGNILYRKPFDNNKPMSRQAKADLEQSMREKVNHSIIYTQPIDPSQSTISFRIRLQNCSMAKSRPFIGLCTKNPKSQQDILFERKDKFTFIIPHGSRQEIQRLKDQSISTVKKTSLCDLYYVRNAFPIFGASYVESTSLRIGDTLTMTVDFEKRHLTWFRNEKSIERSYFELSDKVNIYPFVYLEPETQVTF